ncbi:MAG: TonB-dependent receptor plug domain-containing protein, partial [Psychrosphaera sp.]|nr:TonB-dependent receptor plug domain-containing protein [Psychrosphaera sp.]
MNFNPFIRYITITCAFISAQVIFAVGGATAQPNLDNPFNLTIEQLLAVNISVASRSAVSLSKAPASVTVYSGDDIKRMGITNLEALLNYVPGYMTSREDQARLNTAVVRGRRVNNYSPDILILLDGFRLNDPVVGSAIASVSKLALSNVKQIEIIRGPGSALYGSNAFSGVINIITDNKTNQLSV